MQNHGGVPDHGNSDQQHGPVVSVTVDNRPVSIHRGRATVAEIKAAAQVQLAYDLEQVTDGVLSLLPDDGAVTIKGDEVFVSHPKDAASS